MLEVLHLLMRSHFVLIGFVLLLVPVVSAENYTVYGAVTTSRNTAVAYEPIQIQCSGSDVCDRNDGLQSMTDFSGGYRLTLDVEESDADSLLHIIVSGQASILTIDWNSSGGQEQRQQRHDIILLGDEGTSSVIGGFACGGCFLFFVFTFVMLKTFRRLLTNDGRNEFVGRRHMPIGDCPICGQKMPRYLLVRHLIVDHEIDSFEAGDIVAKYIRPEGLGWSPEDEES